MKIKSYRELMKEQAGERKLKQLNSGLETYNLTLKQKVSRQIDSFKRFCYITTVCAVILYSLLFILTSLFNIYYLFSFVIAYAISITLAFILDKKFVFSSFSPKTIRRQYKEFIYVYLISFIVNIIALYVLVEYAGIWYLLSQLIIGITLTPLLFLLVKLFVFSHK